MLWGPPRETAQTIELKAAGVIISFDLVLLPQWTVAICKGCYCLIWKDIDVVMMGQMYSIDYFCKLNLKLTVLVYQKGPS